MGATVKKVNQWFRSATKTEIDKIKSEMALSERQLKIFDMFYIRRNDIGFIADSLFVSRSVVDVELKGIRRKLISVLTVQD